MFKGISLRTITAKFVVTVMISGIAPIIACTNDLNKNTSMMKTTRRLSVEVLLIGMEAPGNFGPDYKARFDAIYPELADAYGALYAESFFEGLGVAGGDPASVRAFMQPDGIHPNAEGVGKIVEALGPYVSELARRAAE